MKYALNIFNTYFYSKRSLNKVLSVILNKPQAIHCMVVNCLYEKVESGTYEYKDRQLNEYIAFFFAFVYSFPYAILNYFYCVLITRVC